MAEWSLLTNHAGSACVRPRPRVGLRDIATKLDITERSAYGIVTDLTAIGSVVKAKNGRRNRHQVRPHLPLRSDHSATHHLRCTRRPRRIGHPHPRPTSTRVIRAPVAALARVLPHSGTTTHPTFVREATRLNARPIVTPPTWCPASM
jgi:hypothetical protein